MATRNGLRLKGAVIFITHDRYFLDEVATHIYELADQTLISPYRKLCGFLRSASNSRRNDMLLRRQKLRNRYRSELKWIRRGAKARTTKQKARIQRFEEIDQAN